MGKLKSIERKVNSANLCVGSPMAVERIRGGRLTKIRERIAIRDEYTCQMCKRVTGPKDGELDHKKPLSMGGGNNDENLQWL